MPTCEVSFTVPSFDCEREALEGGDRCILHSENPDKDEEAFETALEEHRKEHDGNFREMVFPSKVDFQDATFESSSVSFLNTTFEGGANFVCVTFKSPPTFRGATFKGPATFERVRFKAGAGFQSAIFEEMANFLGSIFKFEGDFHSVKFESWASFESATFERAKFTSTIFKGSALFSRTNFEKYAAFENTQFEGRTQFVGLPSRYMFDGAEVQFTDVKYSLENPTQFYYVDMRKCAFLGTDVQNISFIGARWHNPTLGHEWLNRVYIFDEIAKQKDVERQVPHRATVRRDWPEIERLYRQLKRNYEDRGDFPRAGDFHIGEKEARRRNPSTNLSMKVLLWIYRTLSKYGERASPAAMWLFGVFFACAVGYLAMDASTDTVCLSSFSRLQDWGQALVLSGEATLFPVRSAGFEKIGPRALNLFQRGLSPILLTLLALALRQRVKR